LSERPGEYPGQFPPQQWPGQQPWQGQQHQQQWPGQQHQPWPQQPPSGQQHWAGEQARYRTQPYQDAQDYAQAHSAELAVPQHYAAQAPAQGYGQPMMYSQVQPHNVALAVIASFFIPGLGSMLNEKVGKGIGILACYLAGVVLCFFLIGIVVAPAVWIWGMVAANNDVHKWNRAHGIMS
jgi:TM2 domain-containing membrane protein YozV